MKQIIFTLSLLVCVILTSTAQTPQLFNYQATLRDNSGQLLVSEDISMRISILQFSPNGSPVYTETHAATTTSQGIVNLKIGSGTGADEFASINWSNGPYFLKIEIDTEGSASYIELGTTQLLSVPYALYADMAGEALVAKSASKADTATFAMESNWKKESKHLYYLQGNVGIGTKTFESYYNPKLWLHNGWLQVSDSTDHDAGIVVSHLNKSGYGYARTVHQVFEGVNGDPFTEYRIRNNDDDYSITSWSIGADNDDFDNFKINLRTNHQTGSSPSYGSNIFTLTTGGNVGIGTTMPASMLDVQGDIGSGNSRNLLRLKNNNEGAMSYTGMVLKTGNSYGHSVIQDYSMNYTASTYYDFAGFLNVSNNNRGVMLHANSTDGVIKFYTGHDDLMGAGIERLRIDSEGNVGIGTANPSTKLYIESDVHDGQDRALIRLRNTNIGEKSSVSLALESNDRTYGTSFTQTSESYSVIPDFDRMGVISTNGKGFSIYSVSDYGSIRFYTNKNENGIIERMRINASGNVGIGTTTPNARLEIAEGDVYIKDINKGIIMTSPDGQCWRGTINNSGVLEFAPTDCP